MFFKSNKPEAVQAVENFFAAKKALHASAEKFASAFDAVPIVTQGISSVDYAGFVFNFPGQINTGVWTKPLPGFHRISNLRVKPVKKEFKQEWEEAKLKKDTLWKECFPDGTKVSKNPIFEAFGTDWGNVAFAGFGCFLHDGYVYVDTGVSKLDAEEILGSEYQQAVSDYRKNS